MVASFVLLNITAFNTAWQHGNCIRIRTGPGHTKSSLRVTSSLPALCDPPSLALEFALGITANRPAVELEETGRAKTTPRRCSVLAISDYVFKRNVITKPTWMGVLRRTMHTFD